MDSRLAGRYNDALPCAVSGWPPIRHNRSACKFKVALQLTDPQVKSTPELPSVTLCAVDCLNPALALRALDICGLQCNFGDVMFLSDSANRYELRVAA